MILHIHLLADSLLNQQDLKPLPQPGGGLTVDAVQNALQLVFGIAGAVTLLIVMIAAFQYVISQGDPQSTAKAKNTILYALIGLVICMSAFAIVTFVMGRL